MKALKRLLFLSVLPACLIGCNKSSSSKQLIVWWPSQKGYETTINNAVAEFKKNNPDWSVKVVKKAGLDIYQNYLVALGDDKSRPDLAIIDHVYVQSLAFDGQLTNLSALGSDEDILPNVPEKIYEANTYLGTNYALPMSANTVALMANKSILSKYGIEDVPTTYSEFVQDLETIKTNKIGNDVAFAQPINSTFSVMEFASYVSRMGGKMVSDDCKTVLLTSNEVKKAAVEWWKLSKYANTAEYEEGKFYNGFCGFVEMGPWNVEKMADTVKANLNVQEMLPLVQDGNINSSLGLYSMVIAQKSAKKEKAYELGKYLCLDKKSQMDFAAVSNLFPVTNEALADPYYTSNPEKPYLAVYANQLQHTEPRPGTPVWPVMEKKIVSMIYNIVKECTTEQEIEAELQAAQTYCQNETNRKFGL